MLWKWIMGGIAMFARILGIWPIIVGTGEEKE